MAAKQKKKKPMGRGGWRPGAGRPPKLRAEVKVKPAETLLPAEPAKDDPFKWARLLPEIRDVFERYSESRERTPENSPYRWPVFPAHVIPKKKEMAMDDALAANLQFSDTQWISGGSFDTFPGETQAFLGYTYLSELAQRPEYRVMSETIADDATREWIDFDVVGDEKQQQEAEAKDPDGFAERMADPDERKKRLRQNGKTDKVKALKDDQLRLEVQHRFHEQARNGGFFGRSHLLLDIRVNPGQENPDIEVTSAIGLGRNDATSKTKVPVGSFHSLQTIEPVWTYPIAYNAWDPTRPDWYNPQIWYVFGKEFHGSRLQTFIPHTVPDMLKPAYAFGGLSLSQMAKPYVDIWLRTRRSVADLIHSFSVMVLSTDLSTLLNQGQAGALLARVAMFNMIRDNANTYVVNKNSEDFKNVSAPLGGLHELQAQAQEHMAAVHRIPLVKFTGIQPAGLNASSEGEIKTYDDTIAAYQMRVLDTNLRRIIDFEHLSLWGEVDPEITHVWKPLREMTQAEKGQKEKDDADRNQKYVDMGAIAPAEVRKTLIEDPDLPYTGLDPDDVPDLLEEEEEGLEPKGEKSESSEDANPFGAADMGWNEADHPRSPDGKFGAGGGGGGSGEKTKPVSIPKSPIAHAALKDRFFEAITEKNEKGERTVEVPISKLLATQDTVNESGGESGDAPIVGVMDASGHVHIINGHHRVEKAKAAGKTSIMARVVDAK